MSINNKVCLSAVAFVFFFCQTAHAEASIPQRDWTSLALEDLMGIQVFTAAKKPQPVTSTAAAVYVITSEDIRRSPATSIPELLRMVPGMTVQKVDANTWDISARGFVGSIFANKMLVLIDGRAVYSPLYGGVWWDVQDVFLEDIRRIEVIRGPGGTLWGANAVNGIVNIITKSAASTQGTLVSAGAGSEEQGFGTLRHGGQAGDWFYRAYGKYFNRDAGFREDGTANDEWDMGRAGFRADKNAWTLQGDFYYGEVGQRTNVLSFSSPFSTRVNEMSELHGWNLLTRYAFANGSFQMFWNSTERKSLQFKEKRNRFDMEYTRHVKATDNQEIVWGLGYRLELEDITNTETFRVRNDSGTDQIFSFFIQDEISSSDKKLKFIVGSKFEYNSYTDFEIQPNIRALYHLDEQSQIWAAVSHAVRTPSRLHTDGELTSYSTATGTFSRSQPNDDVDAENITSYELGYRIQPTRNTSVDMAGFFSQYYDLITFDRTTTITDRGQTVQLFPVVNGMDGEVYGVEISAEAKMTAWWKLKGYVSWTRMALHMDPGVANLGFENSLEDAFPEHAAYVQSSFDLPADIKFDTIIRYADNARGVPSYVELDVVLSKTFNQWECSLVGQNLIEDHHQEAAGTTATAVERGGYLKITREF